MKQALQIWRMGQKPEEKLRAFSFENFGDKDKKGPDGVKICCQHATFFVNTIKKFKAKRWKELLDHANVYTINSKSKGQHALSSSSAESAAAKQIADPNGDFVMDMD